MSNHKSRETAGHFFRATVFGSEKSAIWCRENGISVNKAMSEGVNTAGGVLVPDSVLAEIYDATEQYGAFRATADVVPVDREAVNITKIITPATPYFVAESVAPAASQPVFTTIGAVVKKLVMYSVVSSELAEDSMVKFGDIMVNVAAKAFAKKEDECAFLGDGTGTYGGISGITTLLLDGTHNAAKVTAASGHDTFAELDSTDLGNLIGKLPASAFSNAGWFISSLGYATVMCRLAGSVGGITIQETATGRRLPHFMGFPVYLTQALPSVASSLNGAVMLAFGDMRRAAILADRGQITLAKADQAQTFAEDQLQFKVTERIDIAVHNLGDNTTAGAIVGLVGG